MKRLNCPASITSSAAAAIAAGDSQMHCKFTAYSATIHQHVSSISTLPSLLRITSHPSAKTLTFYHNNSFSLHSRRLSIVLCNNRGGGAEDDQAQPIITSSPPEVEQQGDDELPELLQLGNSAILPACFVGLFTGIAIVLFNYTVTNSSSLFSIFCLKELSHD